MEVRILDQRDREEVFGSMNLRFWEAGQRIAGVEVTGREWRYTSGS